MKPEQLARIPSGSPTMRTLLPSTSTKTLHACLATSSVDRRIGAYSNGLPVLGKPDWLLIGKCFCHHNVFFAQAGDRTPDHLVIFINFTLSLPLSHSGRFCHRIFATLAKYLYLEKNACKINTLDFETDVSKMALVFFHYRANVIKLFFRHSAKISQRV